MKGNAYSTEMLIGENSCSHLPTHIAVDQGAAIPVVGLTAYQAVVVHGEISSGQKVFINGCTGGVGSLAVKMSKLMGATISGTCSAKNFDFAKSLGVTNVYDYHEYDYNEREDKYELAFDTTGMLNPSQLKRLGKRIASTGFAPLLLLNSIFSPKFKLISVKPDKKGLEELSQFLNDHKIEPVIDSTFSLNKIIDAHKKFEEGGLKGKILIEI